MAELFFSAFFMSDTRSAKSFLLDSGTWMSEFRVPEMTSWQIHSIIETNSVSEWIILHKVPHPSWDMSS